MMKRSLVVLFVAAVASCAPETSTDVCLGRVEGDLVVTEVMTDPDGTDTGNEYIEIFNTLGTQLDLKGMSVFVASADGTGEKKAVIRAGVVPARGYFVLGDVRSGPNPAWIGYTYGTGLGALPNSSGSVGIKCGTTLIARFTYTTAGKPARSRQLNGAADPTQSAAVETNYCDTPTNTVFSGKNAGTPGAANVVCQTAVSPGTCVDAADGLARAVVRPLAGQLLITELMARPKAVTATNGEWVELRATADVDLNDLTLKTANSTARITSNDCLRVTAGQDVLVARNGDSTQNGGLPTPTYVYTSLTIPDSTQQTLTLASPDGTIDSATVYPSASGVSWQLDPTRLDAVSNDSPDSFCASPARWSTDGTGDFGSPAAPNPPCPIAPDPNICLDDASQANRAIRRPVAGDFVLTEWLSSPTSPQADREFIEAIAKADFDLNGLALVVGSSKVRLISPTCLPVSANSYLVFGRTDDPALNGGLPPLVASFTTNLTGTSTFKLELPDAGLLDAITATGEFPGASVQVAPGFENPTDNDVPANRCKSPSRWDGGIDFGSPGAPNAACPLDAGPPDPNVCNDAVLGMTRPIRFPGDGTLVITEWMPNPAAVSDTAGEYFEVLVKQDADLNGVAVRVGTTTSNIASAQCVPVTADTRLVFAKNADPLVNGGLPPVTAVFGGDLSNTTQTISVFGADGGLFDSITYSGAGGTAAWPAGASVQVRSGFENATDNDLPANQCVTGANTRYGPDAGGDRGTPGLVNVCP